MKNKRLILPGKYLLLIWMLCTAQQLHAGRMEALLYYSLINKAELAICDTDLNTGHRFYQQAFAVNRKPFSKDLMNAFHCAMDTRHYTDAEQYLAELLTRGLSISIRNTCIYGYYTGDQLQQVHAMLQRHRNDTLKTGETAVMIYRLAEAAKILRDQQMANDTIQRLNEQHVRQLCRMFFAKGVPDEVQAGNSVGQRGAFIPVFEPFISVYRSVYSLKRELPLLDSVLYQAIFTLDYDPQLFAINHERWAASYYDQYQETKAFRYGGNILHWPFTPTVYVSGHSYQTGVKYPADVLSRMDKERKAIGLEAVEELYRKFIFLHKPSNKAFRKYQFAGSAIFKISK